MSAEPGPETPGEGAGHMEMQWSELSFPKERSFRKELSGITESYIDWK